ncbi:DinB family protein [Kribbella sp. NBC_00709]|uniref:DinB family protein n=1 Tax=Kribbella sp. NBC_00709 TaxID=2975972 RepID=UPI002E291A4B|nr:DinB family protein [Kribbella sp. NBC_00709]
MRDRRLALAGDRDHVTTELLRKGFRHNRHPSSKNRSPHRSGVNRTGGSPFVEDYRGAIEAALESLGEEQVRRRLVSSATTLLGLVKHVTWMQRVWFEECVGGMSRGELGLVQSPGESFRLADDDTIASVTAAHREACVTARRVVADLSLDAVVTGHRGGPRTLRWVYLQVLRELAQHCGHADILREQLLVD